MTQNANLETDGGDLRVLVPKTGCEVEGETVAQKTDPLLYRVVSIIHVVRKRTHTLIARHILSGRWSSSRALYPGFVAVDERPCSPRGFEMSAGGASPVLVGREAIRCGTRAAASSGGSATRLRRRVAVEVACVVACFFPCTGLVAVCEAPGAEEETRARLVGRASGGSMSPETTCCERDEGVVRGACCARAMCGADDA
jgi:hypothetical protein